MHVPDGFLSVPASLATGVLAVGAVGFALRQAEPEVRRTGPALAGLSAAFVFAVQMVNFPVGAGTSGHLMGGALAAALVGPWTAMLCLCVVLLVQALLFADGGLTALGTNVLLIGVVTVAVGYLVARGLLMLLPTRRGAVVPCAAIGAFVSVPAAALAFVGLYALGGTVGIPMGSLVPAMLGWHTLIGVGEAVITAAVLGAVMTTRPDLVHLARGIQPTLEVIDPDGARRLVAADDPSDSAGGGMSASLSGRSALGRRGLIVAGLVTLIVAGVVSLAASTHPDGLEYVGEQMGFAQAATDSAASASPLADYGVVGVGSPWATGLAGVLGVVVCLAVLLGLLALLRVPSRARSARAHPSGPHERSATDSVL